MDFTGLLVLSVLAEAVFESLKPIFVPEKRENVAGYYVALVLGVLVSFGAGADFFAAAGVPLDFIPALSPYLGIALSGIVIGRGANFVHDIIKALQASRSSNGG